MFLGQRVMPASNASTGGAEAPAIEREHPPHLINLNDGLHHVNEALVYFLPRGKDMVVGTRSGNSAAAAEDDVSADIKLENSSGTIQPLHCLICNMSPAQHDPALQLQPPGLGGSAAKPPPKLPQQRLSIEPAVPEAIVHVNGERVPYGEARELAHNDRVVLGETHFYRFVHPSQAAMLREAQISSGRRPTSIGAADARALIAEMAQAEATRIVKARRMTARLAEATEAAARFEAMAKAFAGAEVVGCAQGRGVGVA